MSLTDMEAWEKENGPSRLGLKLNEDKVREGAKLYASYNWPYEGEENATPEQRAERTLNRIFGRSEGHNAQSFANASIAYEIKDAIQTAAHKNWPGEKPRYAVGVSVLLTSGGQLLLGRRKNNTAAGWLSTPGGRLEPNETILDCARREFFEETGAELGQQVDLETGLVTPRILDVMNLNRFNDHYVMIYVHATSFRGMIKNTEPEKCEGWKWYNGIDIIGKKDVTEPESILKRLPLTWTRSIAEQARIDGWNDAVNMLEVADHIDGSTARQYRK